MSGGEETRQCRKCGEDLYDIGWLFDPCPASKDGDHQEARRYAARTWHAARKVWRGIRIGLKAARILATDGSLPLLLRVLLVLGCIQVPFLPTDELCLAIALGWLFLRHRGTLRTALDRARRELADSAVKL